MLYARDFPVKNAPPDEWFKGSTPEEKYPADSPLPWTRQAIAGLCKVAFTSMESDLPVINAL